MSLLHVPKSSVWQIGAGVVYVLYWCISLDSLVLELPEKQLGTPVQPMLPQAGQMLVVALS